MEAHFAASQEATSIACTVTLRMLRHSRCEHGGGGEVAPFQRSSHISAESSSESSKLQWIQEERNIVGIPDCTHWPEEPEQNEAAGASTWLWPCEVFTGQVRVMQTSWSPAACFIVLHRQHWLLQQYSVVVKALCCKQEGRGFETRWGEWIFSLYLILSAALGPGVYSASKRNEYQKQQNNVSGE
jgi:hypothetical protein